MKYGMELAVVCIMTVLSAASVLADVQEFTDKNEWESAVGDFTTIDFTGFQHLTPISDQYADQGMIFSGNNNIFGPSSSFPNDQWGLQGVGGTWVEFDEPMNWLAVDHPGSVSIQLYSGGKLIFESIFLGEFPNGNFAGVQSSVSFDEAYLFRSPPSNNIAFIDDLHFGPAIPAPGVLGLFALAAVAGRGRRRRG